MKVVLDERAQRVQQLFLMNLFVRLHQAKLAVFYDGEGIIGGIDKTYMNREELNTYK